MAENPISAIWNSFINTGRADVSMLTDSQLGDYAMNLAKIRKPTKAQENLRQAMIAEMRKRGNQRREEAADRAYAQQKTQNLKKPADKPANTNFLFDETEEIDIISQFNVSKRRGAYIDLANGCNWYCFFAAPSCNMAAGNVAQVPFLRNLGTDSNGIRLMRYLAHGVRDEQRVSMSREPFIPILTNAATSFSPADTNAQITNYGETWTRLKCFFLGEDNDSKSGGSFTVEFEDYMGLPVFKTIKAWYEYIQAVRRGFCTPARDTFIYRQVDYMGSMYYFLLAPDGETILYWCKFTGIAPTGLPYSAFSSTESGAIKFSVSFNYILKEDMDPLILQDFNICSRAQENKSFDELKKTTPPEYFKYRPNYKKAGMNAAVSDENSFGNALKSLMFWKSTDEAINDFLAQVSDFESVQTNPTNAYNALKMNKFNRSTTNSSETHLRESISKELLRAGGEYQMWRSIMMMAKNGYKTKDTLFTPGEYGGATGISDTAGQVPNKMMYGNDEVIVELKKVGGPNDKSRHWGYEYSGGDDVIPILRFYINDGTKSRLNNHKMFKYGKTYLFNPMLKGKEGYFTRVEDRKTSMGDGNNTTQVPRSSPSSSAGDIMKTV